LLVVSNSFTKVVKLWFLGKSDFMFDITSQFISFVVMVNYFKLQVVGVYGATTYTARHSL